VSAANDGSIGSAAAAPVNNAVFLMKVRRDRLFLKVFFIVQAWLIAYLFLSESGCAALLFILRNLWRVS
jgi:hypothetical protein